MHKNTTKYYNIFKVQNKIVKNRTKTHYSEFHFVDPQVGY